MSDVQFPINLAAKRCGLTPHVIRVWEKRYQAVSPGRTGTNRRLYSEEEIERLNLLRAAVQAGHRIGTIARLTDDQLRELAPFAVVAERTEPAGRPIANEPLAAALEAVRAFDEPALEAVFDESLLRYGGHGLLANLVVPLAEQIGLLWQNGSLTAAHEHFATAVARTFLLKRLRPAAGREHSPRLVAVTPSGQLHELGAVIVAAAAGDVGWNALYLGASLPAAEIASAAIQHQARAVALSIIYPPDDPLLPAELTALRRHLPDTISILVGGRASEGYAQAIEATGALRIHGLGDLYQTLERLRIRRPGRAAAS